MKKYEITFSSIYPETPLTFWVHILKVRNAVFNTNNYEPPLSKLIWGKGFAELKIHFLGVE